MSTSVLIVDDHQILRDGLRMLLEKTPEVELAGEADNGRAAVKLAMDLRPEVVIMDVAMPDLNGVEATRLIVSESPRIKVLGLSMHSDRRFVTRMLRAGASGYLLKDCAFEELALAIRTVIDNRIYLSPSLRDAIVRDYVDRLPTSDASAAAILTAREREVLQVIAEGRSTKEIAALLNVSVKTVETHRKQIMDKLDLHSIAELTKYALREGLTFLES